MVFFPLLAEMTPKNLDPKSHWTKMSAGSQESKKISLTLATQCLVCRRKKVPEVNILPVYRTNVQVSVDRSHCCTDSSLYNGED